MAELEELEVRLRANTDDISLAFARVANELEYIAKAFRESAGRLWVRPEPSTDGDMTQP